MSTTDRQSNSAAPAVSAPSRVFDVAPQEELLYSMSADGKRKLIHPIVRQGRFWQIRRAMAYGLFALFFALPWIPIGGNPAIFFDIASRRFHLFGATFLPSDNLLLAAFGFGIVVTVFFVGSTFGRMWCGYACPQTVYLEFLFRPIEAFLEGGPVNQRKLNAAPWSGRKVAIKAAKWVSWALVALAMALTFTAYFNGWAAQLRGLATDPFAMKGTLFAVGLLTTAIVFDFGWFRDQMCTIACPYGRLQNVLADKDTLLVAYDVQRGDPKVRVRERTVPGIVAGDCIDCSACVSSCPTGTDIRRGLQSECIGTAQCVDACETVMIGQGKPIGLIKYTSEREQKGGERRLWRPRNLAYLAILSLAWGTLGFLLFTRADALFEIVRGGREPYRLLPNGGVANQQRLKVTNQLTEPQRFTIELVSPAGASLVLSDSPVTVEPQKLAQVNAVVTAPPSVFDDGMAKGRYLVTSDRGFRQEVEFVLLGPYDDDQDHKHDRDDHRGKD